MTTNPSLSLQSCLDYMIQKYIESGYMYSGCIGHIEVSHLYPGANSEQIVDFIFEGIEEGLWVKRNCDAFRIELPCEKRLELIREHSLSYAWEQGSGAAFYPNEYWGEIQCCIRDCAEQNGNQYVPDPANYTHPPIKSFRYIWHLHKATHVLYTPETDKIVVATATAIMKCEIALATIIVFIETTNKGKGISTRQYIELADALSHAEDYKLLKKNFDLLADSPVAIWFELLASEIADATGREFKEQIFRSLNREFTDREGDSFK